MDARHGAHPDVLDFPLVRAFTTSCSPTRTPTPSSRRSALASPIYLTALVMFEYKGAIFWKMTAGMGDIVIAPLYQVLRRRGVGFEFFHRLDALHLDDRRQTINAITMGRQIRLADNVTLYEPLTKVRGLPVFPDAPLTEQLAEPDQIPCGGWRSLETYWSDHPVSRPGCCVAVSTSTMWCSRYRGHPAGRRR